MAEKQDREQKGDYSCEILSFIVLFILSDLSHFWLIMIAICIGIAFWGAGVLLARLVLSAAQTLPWRPRLRKTDELKSSDLENQAFQPHKISQSMDC